VQDFRGRPPQVTANELGKLATEAISFNVGNRQILSDISIRIGCNEIVGLLGRDGSGKTCLFELLAGLVAPSRGRIIFNGADVTGWNADDRARHGLAYLPEEPSIFRELTVEENICLALDIVELDLAARSVRLEELLQTFQLQQVRAQSATSLSGGERRRCEVARALAAQPIILMLDEPFRGLDPMSVSEVARAVNGWPIPGSGIYILARPFRCKFRAVGRTRGIQFIGDSTRTRRWRCQISRVVQGLMVLARSSAP
jgi:lipopolysaccharide export system ATP-binding protein